MSVYIALQLTCFQIIGFRCSWDKMFKVREEHFALNRSGCICENLKW
jgi:hypothetical protein